MCLPNTSLGQGKENAGEYLREHPDLAAQIEEMVRAAACAGQTVCLGPGKVGREVQPRGRLATPTTGSRSWQVVFGLVRR